MYYIPLNTPTEAGNLAFEIGLSEYGVNEFAGGEDNPEVIKYFESIGLSADALHDETAWCSAYMNYCQKQAGNPHTNKLTARSWLTWGTKTEAPVIGDLVVLWRERPDSWKGHVGFYVTERYGWVYILGGNQANRVKISAYPKSKVLGYRRFSLSV